MALRQGVSRPLPALLEPPIERSGAVGVAGAGLGRGNKGGLSASCRQDTRGEGKKNQCLLNRGKKNHPDSVGTRFIFKCIKVITQRKSGANEQVCRVVSRSFSRRARKSRLCARPPPRPDTAKLSVLNSL